MDSGGKRGEEWLSIDFIAGSHYSISNRCEETNTNKWAGISPVFKKS